MQSKKELLLPFLGVLAVGTIVAGGLVKAAAFHLSNAHEITEVGGTEQSPPGSGSLGL